MKLNFRMETKEFGLTYSKCGLSLTYIFTELKSKYLDKLAYLAVSPESHKDGEPHFHCHLQFSKKFKCNERSFDIGDYHPSIERIKDSKNWNDYIRKENPPVEFGTFSILKTLKQKKEKLTNQEILDCDDLTKLVDEEKLSLFALPGAIKAKQLYNMLKPIDLPALPDFLPSIWDSLELPLYPKDEKRRHYWLWSSSPNKGKTTFLKKLSNTFCCSYYSCTEKYQDLDINTQFLLFDEYGKGNSTTSTALNQMCDGTYKFPAKGKSQMMLKDPYLIVCSNLPINEVYLNSIFQDTKHARFIEIDLTYLNFK